MKSHEENPDTCPFDISIHVCINTFEVYCRYSINTCIDITDKKKTKQKFKIQRFIVVTKELISNTLKK